MLLSQHWACSSTTRSSQRPWRSGCSVPCHRIAWHCSVPSSSYRRCCVASAAATPQPPEGQSDDKTPANAVAPRAAPRRSRSQQPQSNSGASSGGPRSAGTPSSNGNANSSDSSSSSNSSRRHGDAAAGGRSSSSSNNDKGDNTAVPAGTSSRAVAGRSSGHVSSTGSTQQPRGQKQRRVGAASSQPQLVSCNREPLMCIHACGCCGLCCGSHSGHCSLYCSISWITVSYFDGLRHLCMCT